MGPWDSLSGDWTRHLLDYHFSHRVGITWLSLQHNWASGVSNDALPVEPGQLERSEDGLCLHLNCIVFLDRFRVV